MMLSKELQHKVSQLPTELHEHPFFRFLAHVNFNCSIVYDTCLQMLFSASQSQNGRAALIDIASACGDEIIQKRPAEDSNLQDIKNEIKQCSLLLMSGRRDQIQLLIAEPGIQASYDTIDYEHHLWSLLKDICCSILIEGRVDLLESNLQRIDSCVANQAVSEKAYLSLFNSDAIKRVAALRLAALYASISAFRALSQLAVDGFLNPSAPQTEEQYETIKNNLAISIKAASLNCISEVLPYMALEYIGTWCIQQRLSHHKHGSLSQTLGTTAY